MEKGSTRNTKNIPIFRDKEQKTDLAKDTKKKEGGHGSRQTIWMK